MTKFLWIAGVVAATSHLADSIRHGDTRAEKNVHVSLVKKPLGLPEQLEKAVGPSSYWLTDYVRTLKFQKAKAFPFFDPSTGKICSIMVSAVKGSQSVPRHKDPESANGYIVAIITNKNACKLAGLDLSATDTAAWGVRFENAADQGNAAALPGFAGVVKLGRRLAGDSWLTPKYNWSQAQCGHQNPHPKDAAMLVPRGEHCTLPRADHDADRVSKTLLARAEKKEVIAGQTRDDPALALWFACGTDCCYSDSGSRRSP